MKILASDQSAYMGIFSIDPVLENASQFAAATSRGAAIVHTHADWVQPGAGGSGATTRLTFADHNTELGMSPIALARQLSAQNSVLAVSWNPVVLDYSDPDYYYGTKKLPVSLQSVIDGGEDAFIREVAHQVRDYGGPIMMSLFGESDAAALFGYGADGASFRDAIDDQTGFYGDPTVLDGPERVRDAFRHVIDLFKAEGATNVTWYMYMGTDYMTEAEAVHPSIYYPGDDYIDWVGQSVYVTSAAGVGASLAAGYAAWGAVTDKPFFVPELGLEGLATDAGRSAELAAILSELVAHDRVKAVTWSDFEIASVYHNIPRLGSTAGEWDSIAGAAGYAFDPLLEIDGVPMSFSDWQADAPGDGFSGSGSGDTLIGTAGADQLAGGAGDDVYIIDHAGDQVLEYAGNGNDSVLAWVSFVLPAHVESLYLQGTAGLSGTGNDLDNILVGSGGADLLNGAGGNDVLFGEAGDDILQGGAGDDMLVGGDGADVLQGGAGNDVLIFGGAADVATGGSGADLFVVDRGGALSMITDFAPNEDWLDVSAFGLGSFANAMATAYATGDGVLLSLDPATNTHLWLSGINVAQLTVDNLIV